MMETNEIENEYNRVKRSLEVLGYKGALGLESVGVVNKLLGDLIKTTEAFKKLQEERDKLRLDLKVQGELVLPLRNENLKLTKENNDLHRDIIKLKDNYENRGTSISGALSQLQTEKDHMELLLKQKDHFIKTAEEKSKALQVKLNDMFNKLYIGEATRSTINPGTGLPDVTKVFKSNSEKGQMNQIKKGAFELSSNLQPVSSIGMKDSVIDQFKHELMQFNLNKEDWANDLKTADIQTDKLRSEIKTLQKEHKQKDEAMANLKKVLESREVEINRLQVGNYVGDDNKEEIKIKYNTEQIKAQNDKLILQIDFLNKENHRLNQIDHMHTHRCREEEILRLDDIISKLTKENEKLTKKQSDVQTPISPSMDVNKHKGESVTTKRDQSLREKELMDQIKTLEKEKKELESECVLTKEKLQECSNGFLVLKEDSNTKISSFNTERLGFNKKISSMANEISALNQGKSKIENELVKERETINDLKNELNLFRSNELLVNQNIEEKTQSVQKIFDEYSLLREQMKTQRDKVLALENEAISKSNMIKEVSNENVALRTQIEKNEESINQFKTQNAALTNELKALKNKESSSNQTTHSLESNLQQLKNQIEKLNQIITKQNEQITALTTKEDEAMVSLRSVNDNYTTLVNEHKILSNELTNISNEADGLREQLRQKEKELMEYKQSHNKVNELENKNAKIVNEKYTKDKELSALQSEIRTLNETIYSLKLNNDGLKKEKDALTKDNDALKQSLAKANENLLSLESEVKATSLIETNLSEKKSKVSEQQIQLIAIKEEVETLKTEKASTQFEIKKKEIEKQRANEALDKLHMDYQVIKTENSNMNQLIEKLQTEILQLKRKENAFTSINDYQGELGRENEQLKNANEKLIYDISSLKEKFYEKDKDIEALQAKITTMTTLLQQCDKTRDEMLTKLKTEMAKSKAIETEYNSLKESFKKIQEQNYSMSNENVTLKQSLKTMDINCDNLTNELDNKTVELSKLELLCKNLKAQNDDLTSKLSGQLNKSNVDNQRMFERDNEVKQFRFTLSAYENDLNQLKGTISERNKEIQDINFDFGNVKNENQKLIEELKRLAKENERLEIIKQQLEQNFDFFKAKTRSHEIDLNDMSENYKTVIKENERLKQNLQLFVDENKAAAKHITMLEANLTNYQLNTQTIMKEKEGLVAQLENLERYNSQLTDEITRTKGKVDMMSMSQKCLKQNSLMEKDININYENYINALNKQIARLENDKKTLQGKLNQSEIQLSQGTMNNSYDANALGKKYDDIIAEERRKALMANNVIQQLTNENKLLKEEKGKKEANANINQLKECINELQRKNASLTNELQCLRNENQILLSQRNLVSSSDSQNMFHSQVQIARNTII